MKRIIISLIIFLLMGSSAHAIVTSTINKTVLACNGSSKTFQYTFPIIDTTNATDLQVSTVTAAGVQTILTTNYSVNTGTATVTYPVSGSACASGSSFVLLRVEPLTQGVAATYQGPGPTPPVMQMSDKLTMITQQFQEQINRAILAPITSTSNAGYYLPTPLASAYLGWDPTGTFITNYVTQGLTTASTPTFAGLTITGFGGMIKAGAGGMFGIGTVGSDYTSPSDTEVFTNKTYDTTLNTLKISGTTFSGGITGNDTNIITGTSIKGNSGIIASASGSPTANNCAKWDTSGNLVDNGSTCSGGTGMIYPASAGFAVTDTSQWLTSISTSGGIKSANINWSDINGLKPISTGGLNWTNINALQTISGAINWPAISNMIGTSSMNWPSINSIANINNGAINWPNLYAPTTSINWSSVAGLLKSSGGVLSAAVSGTDYAPATSGTAILYGNNLGGFSQVTVSTGLNFSGGSLSQSASFGSWTSKSINTSYQASSDGFLICNVDGSGGIQLEIYSDSSNPPTTIRSTFGNNASGDNQGSIISPVRKSDYYKCTSSDTPNGIFFLSLGS